MSRSTVRAAVAAYLSTPNLVTNLTKVFPHPPKLTSGAEFFDADDPGHASGAVLYIHIKRTKQNREGLGGPTSGEKFKYYTLTLICFLRSKKPQTQDVGADNDDFLDSLEDAILADRNAGAPSVVFQWGEGELLYGNDIVVEAGMPRPIRQQMSQVFSVVQVTAVEQLST